MNKLRVTALIVVAAVAVVASYAHIYSVALLLHLGRPFAWGLPWSIDGLVLGCSVTKFMSAKSDAGGIGLATFGMWSGVAGTLAANISYGVHANIDLGAWAITGGAAGAGAPAFAFIITAEVLIRSARRTTRAAKRTIRQPGSTEPAGPARIPKPAAAPGARPMRSDAKMWTDEAWQAYQASVEAGSAMTGRELARDYCDGSRNVASRLIKAASNGHAKGTP